MPHRLTALSGLGAKGPACFLVETGGVRVMLDAGAGPDIGRIPDLSGVGKLDAVILSHAHPDHCGALHLLHGVGDPPIFATRTTLDALGVEGGSELPVQGTAIVAGIGITTGRAGHCAGGIWIRLDIGGGFLYMGDSNSVSPVYVSDPPPPSGTIVIDASYGDDREAMQPPSMWIDAIEKLEPLVMPVPAEGRALELLSMLAEHGIDPIHVDAPVRASLERCLAHDSVYIRPASRRHLERALETLRDVDISHVQGVAVVSNGEASGGAAAGCALLYESGARPSFLFTGYLGSGTPASRMVAARRAGHRRWKVHPTFQENLALVRHVRARTVLPAFIDAQVFSDHGSDFLPAGVITGTECSFS